MNLCTKLFLTAILIHGCLAHANDLVRRSGWDLYAPHISFPDTRWTPEPIIGESEEATVLSLHGDWRFLYQGEQQLEPPADVSSEAWVDLPVPSQPVAHGYPTGHAGTEFTYWYYKGFQLPADFDGKRVLFRCHSIDGLGEIYINGKSVGSHNGPYVPFEFDITEHLRPEGQNKIAIRVTNSALTTLGKSRHMGGISRDTYLLAVPDVYLTNLELETAFDANYENAELKLKATLVNQSPATFANSALSIDLDFKGQSIFPSPRIQGLPRVESGEEATVAFSIPVSSPQTWDTEFSNLYDLALHHRKTTLSTVRQRVGFRQIETRDNKVFLNGQRLRLHGTMHHFWDAHLGTVVSDEQLRADAKFYRAGNINFVRSGRTPPKAFIDACDELGLLTTASANFNFVRYESDEYMRSPEVQEDPYDDLAELAKYNLQIVQAYRNHPSLLGWEVSNESDYSPFFDVSARAIKEVDQSRIIYAASNRNTGHGIGALDIYNEHYRLIPLPLLDKPLLYTEWCHIDGYVPGELVVDPGIRDAWDHRITHHMDYMYSHESVLGGCIFNGIDLWFVYPAVGHPYGLFGLQDIWRRPKPEYWHARKALSPVRLEQTRVSPEALKSGRVDLPLKNRFCFTRLEEVMVNAKGSDGQQLPARASGAPQSPGSLRIEQLNASKFPVTLEFVHPVQGKVDTYVLNLASQDDSKSNSPNTTPEPWSIEETPNAYKIRNDQQAWTIDRQTGHVTATHLPTKTPIIDGQPHLIVTPKAARNRAERGVDDYNRPPSFLSNGSFDSIQLQDEGGTPRITLSGSYDETVGSIFLDFHDNGQTKVSYDFEWIGFGDRSAPDIDFTQAREVGIGLALDEQFQRYSWKRSDQWSYYPPDHPMRLEATDVRPYRGQNYTPHDKYVRPTWPWHLDEEPQGTAEFRSTKYQIDHVSLCNAEGVGLRADSTGCQSARAAMDPDNGKVHVFITDFSQGSACGDTIMVDQVEQANEGAHNLFPRFGRPPLALEPGLRLTGSTTIRLVRNQ